MTQQRQDIQVAVPRNFWDLTEAQQIEVMARVIDMLPDEIIPTFSKALGTLDREQRDYLMSIIKRTTVMFADGYTSTSSTTESKPAALPQPALRLNA